MIDQAQQKLIEQIFNDSNDVKEIIFNDISSASDIPDEFLSFHAKDIYQLELDDQYFCGLRANNFCIEIGYCETDGSNRLWYVITANHKGNRVTVMFPSV